MLEAAELGHRISKEAYAVRVPALRMELLKEQFALEGQGAPVVVIIAGDDRRACNEMLNLLHEWLDARFLHTTCFDQPTEEESARPLYWRYWRALPPRGRIGVMLDAWTTEALRRRIRGEADEAGLDRAVERIRGFERLLTDDGAVIVKFWLHRVDDTESWGKGNGGDKNVAKGNAKGKAEKKRSKAGDVDQRSALSSGDVRIVKEYHANRSMVDALIARTSVGEAPWHVVETTNERFRNLVVGERLLGALRQRRDAPPPQVEAPLPRITSNPLTVLDAVDLSVALDHEIYRERLAAAQLRVAKLAHRAAEAGLGAVIAFEGWDAAGKGGSIRRLTSALDARQYRVYSIGAPSEQEKSHHYLWRFWARLPMSGRVAIFDRSWYGRVLVERVEGFAKPSEWRRAYGEINEFESQLRERGWLVLKIWMHIDPDEQIRRFRERESVPFKQHKITAEDYRNRERWFDYEAAADEMLARTSTAAAPWWCVAANDKKHARVTVLEAVATAFERALGKTKKAGKWWSAAPLPLMLSARAAGGAEEVGSGSGKSGWEGSGSEDSEVRP